MRVDVFYRMWLEEVKKPMLAHSSYISYSNCICHYIIPLYGKLKLKDLTKFHVRRVYTKTYEKSPSVARLEKSILKNSLLYAKRNNYIEDDLVTGVKWEKEIKNKINPKKKCALEVSETIELIQVAQSTELYLPILFAVLMGLRRSEIVGLKYSDIDYKRKMIHIQRQLGVNPDIQKDMVVSKTYTKQEIPMKTRNSKRRLEMPDVVFQAVMEEKIQYEKRKNRRKKEFQDLDYIYCSSYGRPRTANYLGMQLQTFIKGNNLPHITWHNLRYTYTTMILSAGFDLKAVSLALGHAHIETTANIYVDMQHIIRNQVLETEPWEDKEVLEKHIHENGISENLEELLNFV